MKNIALIGCGYWGKNYVNTIANIPELNLKYVVDVAMPKVRLPSQTTWTQNVHEVLYDKDVDGVCVVTPTDTHYKICSEALGANKYVLVEKPMTSSLLEAEGLTVKANDRLMVGHIFMFNKALLEAKRRLDSGELGELRYLESRRVGLGPIRKDVDVMWDYATHDIYISNFLTGKLPEKVSATGISHNGSLHDIVSISLKYPKGVLSNIYVNWEHPVKERKTIIGGTQGAILIDDMQPTDKLTIYQRGVNFMDITGNFGEFQTVLREGDMIVPKIKLSQPLEDEIRHFNDVMNGKECLTGSVQGLETIRVLDSAERSLRQNGLEMRI